MTNDDTSDESAAFRDQTNQTIEEAAAVITDVVMQAAATPHVAANLTHLAEQAQAALLASPAAARCSDAAAAAVANLNIPSLAIPMHHQWQVEPVDVSMLPKFGSRRPKRLEELDTDALEGMRDQIDFTLWQRDLE